MRIIPFRDRNRIQMSTTIISINCIKGAKIAIKKEIKLLFLDLLFTKNIQEKKKINY